MSTRKMVDLPSHWMVSANPFTGEVIHEYEQHSDEAVESKVALAAATYREYRKISFADRAAMMNRAAAILENEKETFGRMMTLEMGKTLRSAIQEAEKCAFACRYYAENAERYLAEEEATTNATRSFLRYQPIGPVLAVMPWNFPFWQVFRFLAPALMAGNVGLLKHSSNVPQCALAIEDIVRRAGFPEGAFQTLLIGSDRIYRVIGDRRVAAITLTGSVGAGSHVAGAAGKEIKKTLLELGGSDPFIVMPTADFDRAVETAVQARVINNGQSCIAAKRFIVHRQIAQKFEDKFVARMASLKVGDPMDPATDLGPLATQDGVRELEEHVKATVRMGARLLLGGHRMACKGNFFLPTVLTDIPPGSPAHDVELFGPVACIYRARDMEHAITIANDSIFGLGACVWTNDPAERDLFISEIESGMAFVNGMVASDPRIPFGGVKHSGYGRELSYLGIREFVNIKSVVIQEPERSKSQME